MIAIQMIVLLSALDKDKSTSDKDGSVVTVYVSHE